MIQLGIIGSSDGNGHPYSWSAIFNGYEKEHINLCPFPSIPEYLALHDFPEDQLHNASVTHIWTQDERESKQIAKFAKIGNVCKEIEELKACDAILLARDDAEFHVELAIPFLKAGIPVFVDKPLALSLDDANKMLDSCSEPFLLFSCTALRYAAEFEIKNVVGGPTIYIEATTPKHWDKYGVHIVEPSLSFIPQRGNILSVERSNNPTQDEVIVHWENAKAKYFCSGNQPSELAITLFRENHQEKLVFKDSFSCFKSALNCFIEEVVIRKSIPIARSETLEIVKILELGMKNNKLSNK